MLKSKLILVLLLVVLVSGCATAGDALICDQTIKAGQFIFNNAQTDEVKQAGADVVNNSTVLQKAVGEAPADAPAYSPEASEQARGQSTAEHANLSKAGTWLWDKAVDVLPGWLIGIVGALGTLVQTLRKKLGDKKAQDTVEALIVGQQATREFVKKAAEDKKLSGAEIDEAIVKLLELKQAGYNVWKLIDDAKKDLKKKGVIKSV